MKTFKCFNCGKEKKVEDNIIIVICDGCQESMHELKKEEKDGERKEI